MSQQAHGSETLSQVPSSLFLNKTASFQERDSSHSLGGEVSKECQSVTYDAPSKRLIVQFSKVPKEGEIFSTRQFDDVWILDFVSRENSREHRCLRCPLYPRDESLYHVHEGNDGILLLRISQDKFVFPKDNTTATYYLPDKDVAFHFKSVPRDGDLFSYQRNDNVVILDILPTEKYLDSSAYSRDNYLFRVQQGDGEFLLMTSTVDNKNMPCEVAYSFRETKREENNKTFTYYIDDADMVFHFTRLPSDGDIFSSRRNHNVMILDVFLTENSKELRYLNSSENPGDMDLYRVEEGDDGGIVLVKTSYCELRVIREDLRRRLVRRYKLLLLLNLCPACLHLYKNGDRHESLGCGHEYHESCTKILLQRRSVCPTCLVEVRPSQ